MQLRYITASTVGKSTSVDDSPGRSRTSGQLVHRPEQTNAAVKFQRC